jgi:hypothetical protein
VKSRKERLSITSRNASSRLGSTETAASCGRVALTTCRVMSPDLVDPCAHLIRRLEPQHGRLIGHHAPDGVGAISLLHWSTRSCSSATRCEKLSLRPKHRAEPPEGTGRNYH